MKCQLEEVEGWIVETFAISLGLTAFGWPFDCGNWQEWLENPEEDKFRARSMKDILTASGVTMKLTWHEEFERKDTSNNKLHHHSFSDKKCLYES